MIQTRQFGRNGPIVSRLSLGTMTFGAETPEADAICQLDPFAERGGTFIDTADVSSGGVSEEIIGCWIAARGVLQPFRNVTRLAKQKRHRSARRQQSLTGRRPEISQPWLALRDREKTAFAVLKCVAM
ncbi:aldo/keto reductase [Jannaschia aquimarina]|uniref:Putative aldo-keto reductase n=1 Tax=Jannaschia aquimarina TaxID=935700 RepID=A0A0D1E9E5_9RHOB|nr:aldo/keto reductase [Jannaschia aquimarina]KIT14254.1 putative aldo-keto reductase [Jannaschia aquimarina]SNS49312.1 Aldo/keto reductase family protein [Jannaschia aquimarina]